MPLINQHACSWYIMVEQQHLTPTWTSPHHRAPSTGAMWLQRAALTHLRVGRVPVARGYQHGRPILNSTSRRCAISLRRASTISSRPQPKRVVDLEPARRVLRETFGHETFRPGQEEVIPRLLSGESMALSWPRHSGSSICYLVCPDAPNDACRSRQWC